MTGENVSPKPLSYSVNEAWLSMTDGDEDGKRMAMAHLLVTLDELMRLRRDEGPRAMFLAVYEICANADPAALRQFVAQAIGELADTGWRWRSEAEEKRWLEEEG